MKGSPTNPQQDLQGEMPAIIAWIGLLAFPGFFVVLTIAGFLRPGYSPISQHGSDLGVGWSGAWILNSALTIFGLTLTMFAAGFYLVLKPLLKRKRVILITILLTIAGAGGILAGVFSEDNPILHAFGGFLIFWMPTIAQVLTGTKLRNISGLQEYGKYTFLNGSVTFLLVIFSTFYPILKFTPLVPLVSALDTQFGGLLQRTQMILTWSWYSVSGLRFLLR